MLASIGRTVAIMFTAVVLATTLIGCASSSAAPDGARTNGARGAVTPVTVRGSRLASTLDLIPDVSGAHVMFSDWSMLGHPEGTGPKNASFAGLLLPYDDLLQRDLGIRSTSANWEIDMWQPGHPETIVLQFDRHTDLAGVARKLVQFGYHANGSVFTHSLDLRRAWTLPLRNIGIATDRQLLVGGPDAAAVRSVLAGSANPLGRADSVIPLLASTAARLGRVATASIAVGSAACLTLADMLGPHVTPAVLAAERKKFTGTFTRPQAEITALADPDATTAVDALTFADKRIATVNNASRMAAANQLNVSYQTGIQVTGSAVTGRVLSFTLTAGQPHDFVQGVLSHGFGVDICT